MAEALRVGGVVAIGGEAAARRVELVQATAVGADPQRARLVLLQRSNPRVAQTLGILRVRRVVHHLPTTPIEAVEAAILRADPEDTILVFVHGPDMIAGQAHSRLRV